MRFATWNVNSIRTRVDRVIAFLERSGTDVLAMQEIKCRPDQFPTEAFEEAGYHVAIHGLNQWNGVAVASRLPILDVQDHFPTQPAFGEPPVVEARALGVTIDTTDTLPSEDRQASSMTIWSLYVPNGRELTHTHYAYKLEWLPDCPRRRLERRPPGRGRVGHERLRGSHARVGARARGLRRFRRGRLG